MKFCFSIMPLSWLQMVVVATVFIPVAGYADNHYALLNQHNINQLNKLNDVSVSQRVSRLERLIYEHRANTDLQKLTFVNDFINQMEWVEDQELWSRKDYWATPLETLIKNAGDCEDFTIAKYFILQALDVPVAKLKISYAKIIDADQAHMVLSYYPSPDAKPLILDNLDKNILKLSDRSDLKLILHFNDEGLWLASSRDKSEVNINELELWVDMVSRMNGEAI